MVQTVLGLVPPEALGHTQTHEHLLIDFRFTLPPDLAGLPEAERHAIGEKVHLGNLAWIRRNVMNADNLHFLDAGDAIDEVRLYRAAGGGTLVDMTAADTGRDPAGLKEISQSTGVHVVMGAGYYRAASHPPSIHDASVSQIAERITQDVLEGADGTDIKSGIIGEIGADWPSHPDEEKVLHAAAAAQAATGVPLVVIPGHSPEAPLATMKMVHAAGADPQRTIAGHLDLKLSTVEPLLELAATGCYLAFDFFGHEETRTRGGGIKTANDPSRIDLLVALIEAGYARQLLISSDVYLKTRLKKYGGDGYAHILDNVIPLMRDKGMSDGEIRILTIENPMRALAIA
jgi:phosphotriesterase-related protein